MEAKSDRALLIALQAKRFLLTCKYDTRDGEIRCLRYGEGASDPETPRCIKKLEKIQRKEELKILALNARILELEGKLTNAHPPNV